MQLGNCWVCQKSRDARLKRQHDLCDHVTLSHATRGLPQYQLQTHEEASCFSFAFWTCLTAFDCSLRLAMSLDEYLAFPSFEPAKENSRLLEMRSADLHPTPNMFVQRTSFLFSSCWRTQENKQRTLNKRIQQKRMTHFTLMSMTTYYIYIYI